MEKNTFKVISGAAAEACERWELPRVGGGAAAGDPAPHGGHLTATRMEEIQQQAYEEGFELGRREGLEKGAALAREKADRIEAILNLLARPLHQLDEGVVEEVSSLALTIARHVVRRELRTDPGQIVAVVQRAAAILPVASRNVRLFVNPADAETLREHLVAPQEEPSGWKILEDPALARGGCRVETDNSRIDASVERQFAALAAELLGGERQEDGDAG
ncbi:MAG: flagellar assembly protein FliH [Gammaproteobacteria bacterium]|nr:flagellar assembly protein FliH [Gammaproteobacteria bacterium]